MRDLFLVKRLLSLELEKISNCMIAFLQTLPSEKLRNIQDIAVWKYGEYP